MVVDVVRLAAFRQPLLITRGDQRPLAFRAILDKIAAAVPHVQQYTFSGAGHAPHLTHADETSGSARISCSMAGWQP